MMKLLLSIILQKRFLLTTLVVFMVYVLAYLFAVGYLIFTVRMEQAPFFTFKILPNWQALMFRQRFTFLFEPIGVVYLGSNLKLFLSVPNSILALVLGSLVAINASLSYYSFQKLGLSGGRGVLNLLGTIPAVVSGAACCVPTLILLIGLQLTATMTTVWSFFIPLSAILLLISLMWSLHKIQVGRLYGGKQS